MVHVITLQLSIISTQWKQIYDYINPLNAELNPTCHLLTLLEAHHILHVSRIRVKERIAVGCETHTEHTAVF